MLVGLFMTGKLPTKVEGISSKTFVNLDKTGLSHYKDETLRGKILAAKF